jgi:hypothetical protein
MEGTPIGFVPFLLDPYRVIPEKCRLELSQATTLSIFFRFSLLRFFLSVDVFSRSENVKFFCRDLNPI